ncbi:MAG TPA: MXAN_5187 C-terminal domain-containing protein [Vicinamibacterales bacterium]|nr:MXAN_5187 C-terminal domain-containing protein [Vicinamibacterales bacterium]
MAPKGSEFDQEMKHLEAEIKRLEAEYNMFFAGRLPRLPWETRARVDALVKRYDRMNIRNTAERFRFNTLQAKYAAFCDLWERALKAREEGRPGPGRRPAPAPPAAPPPPPPTAADAAEAARSRVVHVASFRDPLQEAERMKELYERLAEARRDAGEQQIPYQRFAEVVRAQVNKLGGGEAEVAFRVAVKDGKVTLTARTMKTE